MNSVYHVSRVDVEVCNRRCKVDENSGAKFTEEIGDSPEEVQVLEEGCVRQQEEGALALGLWRWEGAMAAALLA